LAGGVTDAGPTVHLSMTPGSLKAAKAKQNKNGAMIALGAVLILAGGAGLTWRVLSKKDDPTSISSTNTTTRPETGSTAGVIPVVAPSNKVLLEVITKPADATLRIDNNEWKTPVVLSEAKIVPGRYELYISKPGYEP